MDTSKDLTVLVHGEYVFLNNHEFVVEKYQLNAQAIFKISNI